MRTAKRAEALMCPGHLGGCACGTGLCHSSAPPPTTQNVVAYISAGVKDLKEYVCTWYTPFPTFMETQIVIA